MQDLIGAAQPAGWLRPLAFMLLVVPMNLLLGGMVIFAATIRMRAGHSDVLARWLRGTFTGAAIWSAAAGLAALYAPAPPAGPPFHPASAAGSPLSSWPLLPILALLAVALGLVRFLVHRPKGDRASAAVAWACVAILAAAALACSAALASQESAILTKGSAPPAAVGGLDALRHAPSLLPRCVHILTAAVAVSGMIVAVHGCLARRRDPAYGDWVARYGARWFAVPTALQMVVGFWFLLALPGPVRARLIGGSAEATGEIVAGILLSVFVFTVTAHAFHAKNPAPFVGAAAAGLLPLLAVMILLREQVRSGHLEGVENLTPPGAESVAWLPVLVVALLALAGQAVWLRSKLCSPPPAGPLREP